MKYILAIDQGTTSSRAVIYDENLKVRAVGQQSFPQHFPETDWVEHDLEEIWVSVRNAIKEALAKVNDGDFRPDRIVGIGITNQRETFGLWDKISGEPLGRAIVWQCRRSTQICEKLKKSAVAKQITAKTGLVIDPYFSGTKVKWRLDQDAALKKRARQGEVAFGTIDTFLIWRLTRGTSFVTDSTNASRTLFMDLARREWSPFLLKALDVPEPMLPEIKDSSAEFGKTQGLDFLPDGIPICGVLGDQQAALFGQACFSPGEAKLTYGTGAFLLLNTGDKIKKSKNALSTLAWVVNGKAQYALEGSVFIAGAAVQWLRDGLKMIAKSSEVEELARSVPDADGVFFIPALSGLGSPYWEPQAKGLIGGLTRRSTRAHLARATLDGIAHSVADLTEGLLKDAGVKLRKLRVDGGAAKNDILLQVQSNLLQASIERPVDVESTARGAASMVALSLSLVSGTKELIDKNPIEKSLKPVIRAGEAQTLQKQWRGRVKALLAGAF